MGDIKDTSIVERQLVLFQLAEELYGVDIADVHEIIRMQSITKVPKAPFFVEGIINLRGKVIPVADLRKRLGLAATKHTENSRIVVVESEGNNTGMIVDAVTEVLRIPDDSVEPPIDILTSIDSDYLLGVAKHNSSMIILLDLNKVLSKDAQALLDVAAAVGAVPTYAEEHAKNVSQTAESAQEPAAAEKGEEYAAGDDTDGEREMELTKEAV